MSTSLPVLSSSSAAKGSNLLNFIRGKEFARRTANGESLLVASVLAPVDTLDPLEGTDATVDPFESPEGAVDRNRNQLGNSAVAIDDHETKRAEKNLTVVRELENCVYGEADVDEKKEIGEKRKKKHKKKLKRQNHEDTRREG